MYTLCETTLPSNYYIDANHFIQIQDPDPRPNSRESGSITYYQKPTSQVFFYIISDFWLTVSLITPLEARWVRAAPNPQIKAKNHLFDQNHFFCCNYIERCKNLKETTQQCYLIIQLQLITEKQFDLKRKKLFLLALPPIMIDSNIVTFAQLAIMLK